MITKDLDNINLLAFQQPINCCNVTAIAYALTALGHSTCVDDLFYVTRLPIASVLDDGMTLAETYDTFISYIENGKLPFSVRMEYFDQRNMTFETFIQEIERAVSDDKDIHILNFSVSIAHDNFNLSGGHFSLVADYDPNTQEITIADTNPKKYTRFWKCPAERMYKACVDKDSSSTRSRGMIVVRKLDESHQ
ncbi:phytochelatin synthase family protein [Limnoraphis robusta]|uniref:glutathione gamma-glutamylcysteinyltransferase n=1 Tax=Limnoraphis robusta CCNP1315 TaxID=3110306 RepID=A0ABU5U5V9_9CYAN|nr:phytochelatin synthase family protein [Limnoraphis robusta]MEA5496541.1 phytochelatin synthase family protein [Limnoraphis robusta BA-68 BA1]MEA5522564.1 phytochelatin synthase family protein [Limnoraphis robusta CCNP1315]MEA5545072.1 phytochelatin synthase family protein [Limnoraphis robusta CCNP1324]